MDEFLNGIEIELGQEPELEELKGEPQTIAKDSFNFAEHPSEPQDPKSLPRKKKKRILIGAQSREPTLLAVDPHNHIAGELEKSILRRVDQNSLKEASEEVLQLAKRLASKDF